MDPHPVSLNVIDLTVDALMVTVFSFTTMHWNEYQQWTLILLAKRVICLTVLMVFRISLSIFLVVLRLSVQLTLKRGVRLAKLIQTSRTFQNLVASRSIMWFSRNIIFVRRSHYGAEGVNSRVPAQVQKSLALDEVEKYVGAYRYVSPKFYPRTLIFNSCQIENHDLIYDVPDSLPWHFIQSRITSNDGSEAVIEVFSK